MAPTEEMLERARAALPELPSARAERLESELGLPAETAKLLAFRTELGDFFEEAVAARRLRNRERSRIGSRASWSRAWRHRARRVEESSRPRSRGSWR